MKKKTITDNSAACMRRRKIADFVGGGGMVLIATGMLIPLFNLYDSSLLPVCKWIFTVGALMFTGSKCVKALPDSASFRLRRLKRLEFWAGICFVIAAGFWFFNQDKLGNSPYAGSLAIIHDTILFTLSGAVLQLVAAWMIYFREKKEAREALSSDKNTEKSTKKKH